MQICIQTKISNKFYFQSLLKSSLMIISNAISFTTTKRKKKVQKASMQWQNPKAIVFWEQKGEEKKTDHIALPLKSIIRVISSMWWTYKK